MKCYVFYMEDSRRASEDIYRTEKQAVQKATDSWNHLTEKEKQDMVSFWVYEAEIDERIEELYDEGIILLEEFYTRTILDYVG